MNALQQITAGILLASLLGYLAWVIFTPGGLE